MVELEFVARLSIPIQYLICIHPTEFVRLLQIGKTRLPVSSLVAMDLLVLYHTARLYIRFRLVYLKTRFAFDAFDSFWNARPSPVLPINTLRPSSRLAAFVLALFARFTLPVLYEMLKVWYRTISH